MNDAEPVEMQKTSEQKQLDPAVNLDLNLHAAEEVSRSINVDPNREPSLTISDVDLSL